MGKDNWDWGDGGIAGNEGKLSLLAFDVVIVTLWLCLLIPGAFAPVPPSPHSITICVEVTVTPPD